MQGVGVLMLLGVLVGAVMHLDTWIEGKGNTREMKLTQNQSTVLHGLISLILSAVSAAITAIIQKNGIIGQVDPGAIVSIGLIVFWGSFWPALLNYIPAHVQQLLAAKDDTIAQTEQSHNALIAEVGTLASAVSGTAQPTLTRVAVAQAQVANSAPILPGGATPGDGH